MFSPGQLDLASPTRRRWSRGSPCWPGATGLLRTLPVVGAVVLPMAAVASLLLALCGNPHRFSYAGRPDRRSRTSSWRSVAYALFVVAALQALVLTGPREAAAPRPCRTAARRDAAAADARALSVPAGRRGIRAADADARQRHVLSRSSSSAGRSPSRTRTCSRSLGWLTFGVLLFGRSRYGWRGRVALRWILAGTVLLFLAYSAASSCSGAARSLTLTR